MVNLGAAAHCFTMGRKPYNKPVGENPGHYIREWREWRGLTQEQLAGRVAILTEKDAMDVSTISKIETGARGYRQPVLEAFAEALGCDPPDLLRPPPRPDNEIVHWAINWAQRLADRPPAQQERAQRILKDLFPDEAA